MRDQKGWFTLTAKMFPCLDVEFSHGETQPEHDL